MYSFARASLFFVISRIKSCFFCGLVAFILVKTSRPLTRDALISIPAADKSFCRSLLPFKGSSLLFLKSYASSFGEIFRFRPHFPFRIGINDPVSLNCQTIICATVVWPALYNLEISLLGAWQCSWSVKILAHFFSGLYPPFNSDCVPTYNKNFQIVCLSQVTATKMHIKRTFKTYHILFYVTIHLKCQPLAITFKTIR